MDFSKLDRFLNEHLWYYGINGCDVGVVYNGEVVFRKQYGVDDCETGKKINGNELYYIFSASKPVTCTGALRLVEKGLLDLDAPVSKYIPEYENICVRTENGKEKAKNVMTVRNLFTMTAGFNYDLRSDYIEKLRERKPDFTSYDLAVALAEFPLLFEPGSNYCYSLCHDVLAGIVEKITGERFADYQKKNIFEPLGMNRTCFHVEECDSSEFAALYRYDEAKKNSVKTNLSCPYALSPCHDSGGAGMVCCVDDYLKFVSAMSLGGTTKDGYRLINRETIDLMRTNQHSREMQRVSSRIGYGYGLGVRTLIDNTVANTKCPNGEFGWDGAAAAYLLIDPDNKVGIYYGQHTLGCGPLYALGHPSIRNLTYEGLGL